MKGQEIIKQKGIQNVKISILLFVLSFIVGNIYSQIVPLPNNESYNIMEDYHVISDEQYEVINAVLTPKNNGEKSLLYHRAYYDKGWNRFFYKGKDFCLYFTNQDIGLGTDINMNTEKINSILTPKKREEIINRIIISKPLEFEESKLIGIKLVEEFDTEKAIKDKVKRISVPIIIEDIAVMRIAEYSEAIIYILKKENGKWRFIYSFNDYVIEHIHHKIISKKSKENQAIDNYEISDEQYDIINSVYTGDKGKKPVYYRTYYDKGWSRFFYKDKDFCIDFTNQNIGLGTDINMTAGKMDSILTPEKRKKITNEINISKPLELEQSKLKGIKLTKEFDSGKALKQGVVRITNPIIVGNIAVFKRISTNESPIHFLKKENGKWRIIYTFHDWLYLY